jgi:hypothetical protein
MKAAALVLLIAVAITDWLDGKIARERRLISNLGKLLDPLADKVFVTAALVCLVELRLVPGWAVILIIARPSSSSPACARWPPTADASSPPTALASTRPAGSSRCSSARRSPSRCGTSVYTVACGGHPRCSVIRSSRESSGSRSA